MEADRLTGTRAFLVIIAIGLTRAVPAIARDEFDDELPCSDWVEDVIVNGTFVLRDGALVAGARPGRYRPGTGVLTASRRQD